jgi:hypothetical protein
MSGSAGGNRIPRKAVESTKDSYIRKVLSKFPLFKDAKISGSYNTSSKSDFGDIDLIVTLEGGQDKKQLKQDLAAFFAKFPDNLIVPFRSDKYRGKKSLSSGELVTILYPIEGMPGEYIQIDNMISTSEQESDFKKAFLDYPAEIQGLLLGLTKVVLLEEDPQTVFKRLGIKDVPPLEKGQEYEFNLSGAALTLRIVDLSPDFKETGRKEVWKTTDWNTVKKLYDGYRIDGTFEELLQDIKRKCKNERSKNRIKGIFKSMVSIKSGEVGTAKGAGKQKALDSVDNLLEFMTNLGRLIGEEVVNEPGICFYPGGFKPPHKGHFEVAKDMASRNYITAVYVIISKKERDGITAEQSLKVWQTYLKAEPNPKISVGIAKSASPIRDIFDYIAEHPEQSPIYIVGGKDEVDDQNYFASLKKAFGDKIKPVPMEEKFGRISASYVRRLLRAGDLEGFKEALPDATINKGHAGDLFKMLASTITQTAIKEGLELDSEQEGIVEDIEKFLRWCSPLLDLKQIPEIEYITDPNFPGEMHSFGGYNPTDKTIATVIVNRNLADILRTLAHELVHHCQNEKYGITAEDGKTGSDVENEANAVAGQIMREYGKRNPDIYTQIMVNESVTPDEIEKVDAFADNILAPVDVDLTSKHVLDRLTGRESDVTYQQLIKFFENLSKKKKEFLDFFNRYSEIVATDRQSKLNIPFLNLTHKAIAKTIMRKPNFLTHTPQLTFEDKADAKCPPATQSIPLNLKNRQSAIEKEHYGPLNPNEPNVKFWKQKADMWQLDSIQEAKKSLCGNCAAFDITKKTLACIAKGIGTDGGSEDPHDVIEAGQLGYCRFLKFKCASARTCDAWVVGGPLTDKK